MAIHLVQHLQIPACIRHDNERHLDIEVDVLDMRSLKPEPAPHSDTRCLVCVPSGQLPKLLGFDASSMLLHLMPAALTCLNSTFQATRPIP